MTLLLIGGVSSTSVYAQVGEDQAKKAEELYREASKLFKEEDYRPALERFMMGYGIFPDPNFIYNAARCYEELGETEAAIEKFNKFLSHEDADSKNRKNAVERLSALHAKRAEEAKAKAKAAEPPPTSAPVEPPTSAPTTEPPPPKASGGPGAWPWIGVGLGAALLAGGTVFYMNASGDYDDANDPATSRADALTLWDDGDDKATVAYGLWAGGAALALGGAAWLLLSDDEPSALAPALIVEGEGGLLSVQGRF